MTIDEMEKRLVELDQEREAVETEMADIRGQIDKSSADFHSGNGGRDPAWYGKAKGALRYRGIDHQSIIREAADLRRKIKDARHAQTLQANSDRPVSWYFYQVAQRELPDGVFSGLFAKALMLKEQDA